MRGACAKLLERLLLHLEDFNLLVAVGGFLLERLLLLERLASCFLKCLDALSRRLFLFVARAKRHLLTLNGKLLVDLVGCLASDVAGIGRRCRIGIGLCPECADALGKAVPHFGALPRFVFAGVAVFERLALARIGDTRKLNRAVDIALLVRESLRAGLPQLAQGRRALHQGQLLLQLVI